MKNRRPKRRYPWGEQAEPSRANYRDSGILSRSAVGCFPNGASPYGCEEISGNVFEWTLSLCGEESAFPYPYAAGDGRENQAASTQVSRAARGGSFFYHLGGVRSAYRGKEPPGRESDNIGFRVVLSPIRSGL